MDDKNININVKDSNSTSTLGLIYPMIKHEDKRALRQYCSSVGLGRKRQGPVLPASGNDIELGVHRMEHRIGAGVLQSGIIVGRYVGLHLCSDLPEIRKLSCYTKHKLRSKSSAWTTLF